MKKTLCGILTLALLASMLLTACGTSKSTKDTTTADTTAAPDVAETQATAPAETEPASPFVADELPSDLNYGGKTFTLFGWSGMAVAEFFVEQQDGELVNDALYARNRAVEDRLGVELAFRLEPGRNAEQEAWLKIITASILANDHAYDIVAGYSMAGASLAAQGFFLDLNTLPHIDLDKPWWPSALQDEATCEGKLFFCSGDISTYYLYNLYCILFNTKMAAENNIEDLYALVLDGKWTLDKMMTLSSGLYSDLNGDGTRDVMDRYGYSSHAIQVDPYYFASGLKITEKDNNDTPYISDDFKSEKTADLVSKLVTFFSQEYAYLGTVDGSIYANFPAGNSLFTAQEVMYIMDRLRTSDIEYGVLPIPKYDEQQEDYITILSFPYSLYGVPTDATDPNMSAAVMECMASESYRGVSPALFETALKIKYAHDNQVGQMYDIIRATATFDLGRVYTSEFENKTYGLFRDAIAKGNTAWASVAQSNVRILEKMLEKLVNTLTQW